MADTATVSRGLVLLADDEDSVRSMVRRMLERAGFDVIEARNGFDAITIARSEERCIDLLVTDVQMPGMQGPELSERLAEMGLVRRVLLCSGYSFSWDCETLEGAPRWSFLAKPFAFAELTSAIDGLLGSR